jgi:hypothetical protein
MPRYNTYNYIYPPRPKNPIPIEDISKWDNKMMLAQPKMNGSNCVLFMNGEYTYTMNRHGQRLTNFQLNKSELLELYKPVKNGNWLVINGEYMNKSKSDEKGLVFNHKLVIFDILVYNSDYLLGSTFESRIKMLDELYGTKNSEKDYLYQFTDNIYRVKSYENDFVDIFNKLTKIDMIEGLVMKRKKAKLELGSTENNNTKSMIKARKPTKNYKF